MASIFVQIASYHDFELGKTIADVSFKASGEYDIRFGVHHSYYQEKEVFIPKMDNLALIETQAPDYMGVGASRGLANSLYDGEDYYLQIDGHTRMGRNWDNYLVDDINSHLENGVPLPLLTTYPASYSYDDDLREKIEYSSDVTAVSFAQNPGAFANEMIPSQLAITPDRGNLQRGISAGFVFTVGDFANVGFNDKIMFLGEEILLAASSYTNGFDLFIPERQHSYHLYFDHSAVFQKNMRRHVWKDFPQEFSQRDTESKAEVIDIFTTKRIGPGALGYLRTLEEYGEYAGLDFDKRKIIPQEEINE